MSTECSEQRSGWEFTTREKAYFVYMFTLQKRNYGVGSREYCKQHNINRDTFRGWMDRYPEGRPFYDVNNEVTAVAPPAKAEPQMVKLSQEQLISKPNNAITDIRRESYCSSSSVMIKFYDSVISVDSSNISLVLSAIKNVSSGQGR